MSDSVQIVQMILQAVGPLILAAAAWIQWKIKVSNDMIAKTNQELINCAKERQRLETVAVEKTAKVAEDLKAHNSSVAQALLRIDAKVTKEEPPPGAPNPKG